MKPSIIIPAFNEAAGIGRCLQSIRSAVGSGSLPAADIEVIVVDNNSTDATARIAREHGAAVVFEPINQISRARNAGAWLASGDWLVFLDADTQLSPQLWADLIECIENGGCVGGGSVFSWDVCPWYLTLATALVNSIVRWLRLPPGAFIFCRRDAFREIGGFDEALYALEDRQIGFAMKRWASEHRMRVAILHRHPPTTSSRKLFLYRPAEVAALILRMLLAPSRTSRDRGWLGVFYDGRR